MRAKYMKRLKIGIIGCGTIGSELARSCVTLLKGKIELVALYDIDTKKSEELSHLVKGNIVANSMDEVFEKTGLRSIAKKHNFRLVNLSKLPSRSICFQHSGRDVAQQERNVSKRVALLFLGGHIAPAPLGEPVGRGRGGRGSARGTLGQRAHLQGGHI